ncbi:MAG: SPOR domain-containing protein [Campylobacterales bacterium]|nr:SPOR domain-containing protein [Campylobacterales bacterium]
MEDKNELSDIVLDKDTGSKGMKLKRILVIAAVLVLLFLVVLIIMRALNAPTPEQEARLILPPEPQSVPVAPNAAEEKLFQQVPIINEEPKESFEDMVKKLKEKEMNRTAQAPQEAPSIEPEPREVTVPLPPQQIATPTPQVAPVATPTPPATTPKAATSQGDHAATSGIYIQVASVTRTNPDAAYLKSITDKSYAYRLYRTTVGEQTLTKVLVGPYATNEAARTALASVKQNLSPNAFIFRVP